MYRGQNVVSKDLKLCLNNLTETRADIPNNFIEGQNLYKTMTFLSFGKKQYPAAEIFYKTKYSQARCYICLISQHTVIHFNNFMKNETIGQNCTLNENV